VRLGETEPVQLCENDLGMTPGMTMEKQAAVVCI
jgi:hypothetical protein